MIPLLLGTLGFAAAIVLPGWLAAQLLDEADGLFRAVVGVGVGVFVVPAVAFLAAWGLGTSVTWPLLLGTGLALAAALAGVLSRR